MNNIIRSAKHLALIKRVTANVNTDFQIFFGIPGTKYGCEHEKYYLFESA